MTLRRIDHWDYEREKLILLTASSLLVVKYDFIRPAIIDTRRISLSEINDLQIGDLVYPSKSLMGSVLFSAIILTWFVSVIDVKKSLTPRIKNVKKRVFS